MKNKTVVKINKITTIYICCVMFLFACFMCTFSFLPEKSVMAVNWSTAPSDLTFLTTGDGTISNPYKISSAEQLATVSKNIATYKTKSFKLIQNLDISKYTWVPIGTVTNPYSGTLDGNGCSISGIRIDASLGYKYAGLFGYLSGATIKNLTMVDEINTYVISKISSGISYAGALAGYATDSTFENVLNFNVDIYSLSKNMSSYSGGIVGYAFNTSFNRAINMGNVNSLTGSASYNSYAGGIAGYSYSRQFTYTRNDGIINSFYSKSFNFLQSLSAYGSTPGIPTPVDEFTTKTYAGGIVGYCETNISLSYNTNIINAGIDTQILTVAGENIYRTNLPFKSYAGGIVGYTKNSISDAYNLGNITSNAVEITSNAYVYSTSSGESLQRTLCAQKYIFYATWYDYVNVSYGFADGTNAIDKDTYAYAGGIVGYSNLTIEDSYNDGVISGGKKLKKLELYQNIFIQRETHVYLETGGSGIDYDTTLYTFNIDFSYADTLYYGSINGNRTIQNKNTYGISDLQNFEKSIILNTYKKQGYSGASLIYSETFSSDSSSTNMTIGDYISNIKFNASVKKNFNTKNAVISLLMNYDVYKREKNWLGNPVGDFYKDKSIVSCNFLGIEINQKIQHTTVSSASSITTTNLGGNTYWAKTTGINGNRPYLKNFYW